MVISADKEGRIDPVWYSLLKEVGTDIPIVPITKLENYQFNDELYRLGKWILCCGVEYGWDHSFENTGTHFWGVNTFISDFGLKGEEWQKFDKFISNNPPVIVFKRELMQGNCPLNYYPINYPCWYDIPEIQTKDQFDSRPLQANFIWGLSHEYRKNLHGEIWQRAGEFGYVVCDNVSNVVSFIEKEDNPKKWVTANVPWYARHGMDIITKLNELSKVSISISGAGRHCFRHSESPMASVMYMWDSGIKYSYPWIHNVNCIMSKQGKEIETVMEALNNQNLYDIYTAGVENCKKYFLHNYVKNYIEPLISKYEN